MKVIFVITILTILATLLSAQDVGSSSPIFVAVNLTQIKESANFGLVYTGPGLEYGMRWENYYQDYTLSYDFKLGLAYILAKDTKGGNVNFKPIELAYLRHLDIANHEFKIGGALKGEYNFQIYGEVQSGFDYWLTNYCAGLVIGTSLPMMKGGVEFRFFNNLFGMISRNETYKNPYFYDLDWGEVFSDVHQDFRFATLDSFDNTVLEITFSAKRNSRFSISYIIDYTDYYRGPKLEILTQSIRFNFN